MGFRNGAYATVWEISTISNTMTKGNITINRKVKDSDEYEKDFGDFVSFVGSATAKKALSLKKGDRIKLGDVDVSSVYNKEKGRTYYNFKIFSFESVSSGSKPEKEGSKAKESDECEPDGRLPF